MSNRNPRLIEGWWILPAIGLGILGWVGIFRFAVASIRLFAP